MRKRTVDLQFPEGDTFVCSSIEIRIESIRISQEKGWVLCLYDKAIMMSHVPLNCRTKVKDLLKSPAEVSVKKSSSSSDLKVIHTEGGCSCRGNIRARIEFANALSEKRPYFLETCHVVLCSYSKYLDIMTIVTFGGKGEIGTIYTVKYADASILLCRCRLVNKIDDIMSKEHLISQSIS